MVLSRIGSGVLVSASFQIFALRCYIRTAGGGYLRGFLWRGNIRGIYPEVISWNFRILFPLPSPTSLFDLMVDYGFAMGSVVSQQFWSMLTLMGTLTPQSNGPLCSNTVIGTLAVDG